MARSHSDAPAPTSDVIHAVQLRSVVRGDLRALVIPAEAVLASDVATQITETDEGAPQPGRLGAYLRAQGLITEDDLAAALAEQRQRTAQGQPIALGDLLVEHGHLTVHELVTVLMLQQLDRRQAPTAQTSPLGELLVRARLITAEQLAAALTTQTEARQRGETIRLGEILIGSDVLTRRDLATSLLQQRRTRRR
jgi:hypothetical protein